MYVCMLHYFLFSMSTSGVYGNQYVFNLYRYMMLDVWNMYYYLIIWLICFCLQCGHSCTIRGIRNSYFTTDNSISSIPTTTPFCSFAFQTDSPVTLSTEYLRPLTGSTNVSSTKSNSTLRTLVFKELLLLFLNAFSVFNFDLARFQCFVPRFCSTWLLFFSSCSSK